MDGQTEIETEVHKKVQTNGWTDGDRDIRTDGDRDRGQRETDGYRQR